MDERRSPTPAESQASAWLVRLKSSDVTHTEKQAFAVWLAASPDNQRAFSAMEQTWDRLGSLAGTFEEPRRPAPYFRRSAIAATIVAAIAVAAIFIQQSSVVHDQVVASAVGEHLTKTLPDGSTITLNSNSRLSVRYSTSARRVHLSDGEALFDVVAAPGRPFIVETRLGVVQVKGTSFVVRVTETQTRATVLRGVVEGHRTAPKRGFPGASPVPTSDPGFVAHAGDEITFFATGGSLAPITPQTSARRLAWRDGMLAFDGETLAEATAEVTRQTGVSFEFMDPSLRSVRIGGYVQANDPEAFVQLLEANFGVVARRDGSRVQLARP